MTIVDTSRHPQHADAAHAGPGIELIVFGDRAALPRVRAPGDIVRLHRVRVRALKPREPAHACALRA